MKRTYWIKQNRRQGGYAMLLGLFIVLFIGVIYYYKSFIGPGLDITTGEKLKNPPWKQWYNVRKNMARSGLGKPTADNPEINEPMGLVATLFEGKDERGTISLMFDPNYTIEGGWGGTYSVGPNKAKEYDLGFCKIRGYLVPNEACLNVKSQHNPGEVYFIATGVFIMVEYNNEKGKGTAIKLSGDIYVTGWLAPDYTINRAQAFITSDQKHFKLCTFSGKAEKFEARGLELLMKKLKGN